MTDEGRTNLEWPASVDEITVRVAAIERWLHGSDFLGVHLDGVDDVLREIRFEVIRIGAYLDATRPGWRGPGVPPPKLAEHAGDE